MKRVDVGGWDALVESVGEECCRTVRWNPHSWHVRPFQQQEAPHTRPSINSSCQSFVLSSDCWIFFLRVDACEEEINEGGDHSNCTVRFQPIFIPYISPLTPIAKDSPITATPIFWSTLLTVSSFAKCSDLAVVYSIYFPGLLALGFVPWVLAPWSRSCILFSFIFCFCFFLEILFLLFFSLSYSEFWWIGTKSSLAAGHCWSTLIGYRWHPLGDKI